MIDEVISVLETTDEQTKREILVHNEKFCAICPNLDPRCKNA